MLFNRSSLRRREKTITYQLTGDGIGQLATVNEKNTLVASATQQENTVTYAYHPSGERASSLYDVNDNGTHFLRKWAYKDYTGYGFADGRRRLFTKMVQQSYVNSAWVDSADE